VTCRPVRQAACVYSLIRPPRAGFGGSFVYRRCACRKPSTSCDQAKFVDQATDASVSLDSVLVEVGRLEQRFQRRGTVQGTVTRC
jgi:hypothetical protein